MSPESSFQAADTSQQVQKDGKLRCPEKEHNKLFVSEGSFGYRFVSQMMLCAFHPTRRTLDRCLVNKWDPVTEPPRQSGNL